MQAKPTTSLHALALLTIGIAAGVSCGVAQAGPDDLDRVEVNAQQRDEVLRTNVRSVCPDLEASLQQSLAVVQYREGREGITTVSFRLSGSQIDDISQRGPAVYRAAIRRAVHQLDCQASGRPRHYVMQLEFRNQSDEPDAPSRVALKD